MDNKPGTYALILQSNESQTTDVGRIGQVSLKAGYYVYVGSAHGPGGVSARVGRHLSRKKTIHWHIDYVTTRIPVFFVLYKYSSQRLEHNWSACIAGMRGVEIAAKGFGSSDCRCRTHLYFFRLMPVFSELKSKYGPVNCLIV